MTNKLYISAHLQNGFEVKATHFPITLKRAGFATVEVTGNGGDLTFFLRNIWEAGILRDAFAAIQARRQEKQEAA